MKAITHALLGFVAGLLVLTAIALTTGCAVKQPARPVHVANVAYHAHFDRTRCRYLQDGIQFRCKDVVFDPTEIDASGRK